MFVYNKVVELGTQGSEVSGKLERYCVSARILEADIVEKDCICVPLSLELWKGSYSVGSPVKSLHLDAQNKYNRYLLSFRDLQTLRALQYLLRKSLIEVILLVEWEIKDAVAVETVCNDSDSIGTSRFRLDIMLCESILGYIPNDLVAMSGPKERHHVQRLAQILRANPHFAYPQSLHVTNLNNAVCQREHAHALTEVGNLSSSSLRDRVFHAVKPLDWAKECNDPSGLKCTLYKYQRRALAWMQLRESGSDKSIFADESSIKSSSYPSIRFIPIALKNQVLYFDFCDGVFSTEPMEDKRPNGGLLCDEMGLGKTVEIISLILAAKNEESSHRKRYNESSGKLRGGTLVVAPPALLQQWASELQNHAGGSLKVEIYSGIRHELEREEKRRREEGVDLTLNQIRTQVNRFFTGLSRSKYGTITEDMVREAHLNALKAAGEPLPVEDPTELVLNEARRIAVADVVLTSFDVLKNEIHYDASKNERSLRNAKRYLVPDCALLKVDFFRMVADEAQMIGSFGQVAQMTEKISARNRWCVTGTPMVTSNELSDLKSLLSFLGVVNQNFDLAWQKVIVPGFKSGNAHLLQSSWASLVKALIPIMWRTDKMTVRSEFKLPPRMLHLVPLRFQPGESELYSQLVEKARQAHTALEVATESLKAFHNDSTTSKRAFEKKMEKLHEEERLSLLQLRLACIHPQLTKFWRQEMAGDLQLGSGGTTSMGEVLQRLVDKEQGELQEAERILCAYLNTLAMRLIEKADKARKKKQNAGAGGVDVGASPDKYASLASDPEGLLKEARALLQKSQNVSEKGIRALDLTQEDAAKLPDPEALAASSWSAWRRIQINTAHQMVRVLTALGAEEEELNKYSAEKAKRSFDYVGSAQKELEHAKENVQNLGDKINAGMNHISNLMDRTNNHSSLSRWGTLKNACEWWTQMEEELQRKKTTEAQQLSEQESKTEKTLGTIVTDYLSDLEKCVRHDLTPLESWVVKNKVEEAIGTLQRSMNGLDSINWNVETASLVPLKEFRYLMGKMASLLTPFKRDTILNQFSQILPVPREVKALNIESEQAEPAPALANVLLEESLGYSKPMDAIDPVILEHAAHHEGFIPAEQWSGRVKGYAFFKSDKGLGYHLDSKSADSSNEGMAIRYLISQCSQKLLHDLQQRLKALSKNISPENAALFEACNLVDVEARLDMTTKTMECLRLSRDLHIAVGSLNLKQAILQGIEADVDQASSEYPIKNLKQVDKILKKIEEQQEQALDLQHKKTFMVNRLKEVDDAAVENTSEIRIKDEDAKQQYDTMEQANDDARSMYGPAKVENKVPGVECPVCLSEVKNDLCLWSSCGHAFCRDCSDQLFQGSKQALCPVCRSKCSHRHVLRVAAHRKTKNPSIERELDPTAANDPIISSVSIGSDWSIKISALLRRILALRISAPTEKSLIFSQFTDALKVVSLALKAHEIPHVHLYGRSKDSGHAIQAFREDESVKCFLIAQKAGAQGMYLLSHDPHSRIKTFSYRLYLCRAHSRQSKPRLFA